MRKLRVGAVAVAAAVLVVVAAGPSFAHYVYEKGRVYSGGDICTDVRAEVSHGGGGGFAKADVYGRKELNLFPWGSIACGADDIRPTGYLAATWDWWYHDGYSWVLCGAVGWGYNPYPTHHFAISWDDGSTPACGAGYYGTTAYGFNLNGGQWYGGPMWSGQHWLPA